MFFCLKPWTTVLWVKIRCVYIYAGSHPGRPGHGSTRRVDRVWPVFYIHRSFEQPGPVQCPGWPGPGSTCRAGSGFITMIWSLADEGKARKDLPSLFNIGVIIFVLVQFLLKKIIKLIFLKKTKTELKPVQID